MLLRRNLWRVTGVVLLAVFFGSSIYALLSPPFVRQVLIDTRWYLIALGAIVVVSNAYRLVAASRAPVQPPAKPRPAHLKLVKNDETLH